MNLQMLKEKGWIIFEAVSGSHAYGTNVKGSDVDIRGVFILPNDYILSDNYISQVSDDTNDTTFYEIGRFIELASKGNPNILELLNMPEDCVQYKDPIWDQIFTEEVKKKFITKKLKHTFTGYAYSQIKKAKGLNKKINWESSRVERKDVLDFCYVIDDKEKSLKFKQWVNTQKYCPPDPQTPKEAGYFTVSIPYKELTQEDIGLAKVNNIPDLYSMYLIPGEGGVIGEDSNDVQLKSIPKCNEWIGYLRFDRNAYSTHCKDYREYQRWLEERNEQRYSDNLKGEIGYDHKNMMHCFRLLGMAKDIAEGKGITVRRPDNEVRELLAIRNGEMKYQILLDNAEAFTDMIGQLFDKSDLPNGVSPKFRRDLLLKIRKIEI